MDKYSKIQIQSLIDVYEKMAEKSRSSSLGNISENLKNWEEGRAVAYQQAADAMKNLISL